ncbi:MAG: hypothetical protein QG660_1701 [Pseudomonadota bacterium]|nr:hypothetical protein [Pseudomonadota bacterium]MDQ5918588.1 hypothetical protein [Pseudomonadota bacterium]MDQ5942524.1 hypothetical protein [Pseudomonadota bacterium]MDQ5946069.1 hypothetical protein [Pseudomonadota bacterium]
MKLATITVRLLALAVFACGGNAYAAKGHVHGAGTLDVSIEGNKVSLALELPLDAATGFERAPKTPQEKAALEEAGKVLNNAATLFTMSPAANCTVGSVNVTVPYSTTSTANAEHADLAGNYVFQCANPAALTRIETTLFKQFKRLYRLEVRRVGPGGQGASRLTPKQPTLSW